MAAYFNLLAKGLIAGIIAMTPYLSADALLKNSSMNSPSLQSHCRHQHGKHKKKKSGKKSHQSCSHHDEELELQLQFLWFNETVFLHDYALAALDLESSASSLFVIDNNIRLTQNAQNLALLIFPHSLANQQTLIDALNEFVSAGEAYANALTVLDIGGDPTNPEVVAILRDEWLPAADNLANVLSRAGPDGLPVITLQQLLERYTILLANMINDLSPRFIIDPSTGQIITTVEPNFIGASFFYQQARILATQELAPLIAQGLNSHCHHG